MVLVPCRPHPSPRSNEWCQCALVGCLHASSAAGHHEGASVELCVEGEGARRAGRGVRVSRIEGEREGHATRDQ